jgi:hypothetical protein
MRTCASAKVVLRSASKRGALAMWLLGAFALAGCSSATGQQTSSTLGASAPQCLGSQLSLISFAYTAGSPGEGLAVFGVINASPRLCTLRGRPTVRVFEGTRPVSLGASTDDTEAFLGEGQTVTLGRPSAPVSAHPPISAAFIVASRDFPNGTGGYPCPVASSVTVGLPGVTSKTFHMVAHFNLCDSPPPASISNVIGTQVLLSYVGAS